MSFTPSIPQSGQSLGQTLIPIQNNFTNYNTVVSVDHVAPNNAGQGKHNHSTYPEQGSDATTLIDECALYSKAVAGVTELFFRRENNGNVIQMTNQTPTAAPNGGSFLPGGIIILWGQVLLTADGATITFPNAFPNNCWSLTLQLINNSNTTHSLEVQTVTKTSFVIHCDFTNKNAYFIAIGN